MRPEDLISTSERFKCAKRKKMIEDGSGRRKWKEQVIEMIEAIRIFKRPKQKQTRKMQ